MTRELHYLLDRALTGVDALPAADRATLYEGVAQIVKGDAREEAKKMAFANRNLAAQERKIAALQTEFLTTLFA